MISLVPILFLHSFGIPSREAKRVVPKAEYPKMFWSSRACLALHLLVIVAAVVLRSWLPILLFSLPRLYGGILMWTLTLAQHSGLRKTSSIIASIQGPSVSIPCISFLYLHMEYHTEHHLYPNIPFHSLAKFPSRLIEDQMPRAYNGLWETYREEIPVLWKQRPRRGVISSGAICLSLKERRCKKPASPPSRLSPWYVAIASLDGDRSRGPLRRKKNRILRRGVGGR